MKNIVSFLSENNIVASKGEARHLIVAGAIKVNGERVTDTEAEIQETEIKIRKGKSKEYVFS